MMKRRLPILLMVTLLLAACSGDGAAPTTAATGTHAHAGSTCTRRRWFGRPDLAVGAGVGGRYLDRALGRRASGGAAFLAVDNFVAFLRRRMGSKGGSASASDDEARLATLLFVLGFALVAFLSAYLG